MQIYTKTTNFVAMNFQYESFCVFCAKKRRKKRKTEVPKKRMEGREEGRKEELTFKIPLIFYYDNRKEGRNK